jgi:transcription initiation factor TFIIIB Brf1 subunit/transcription initiation factor TFIIB
MPPKPPSSCKYCGANSTGFVFDESSGQLTCTDCGSQLGGTGRIDFGITGETRTCAAAALSSQHYKIVISTQVR